MSQIERSLGASTRKNLSANLIGKIWVVLVSAAFTPLYIKYLGVESYGIVGLYTTFTLVFTLLDFGLQTTVNRELARLSAEPGLFEKKAPQLIRTFEWIYWPMAIVIGLIVFCFSSFLAENWINPKSLSQDTVKQSLYWIGIALALQWPSSLYHGSLMGLQRHVVLNGIFVAIATLKGFGMIVVLKYVSPSLDMFFTWQIFLNGLQTFVMAFAVWKSLPKTIYRPHFSLDILRQIKKFAIGSTGTAMVAILLAHLDKIILSKLLSLEMFGYYSLGSMLAATLSYVSAGFLTTYYPQFSKQAALEGIASTQGLSPEKEAVLSQLYHRACQYLSVMIIPIALIAIFFSRELLVIWTQNREIANQAYLIVSLLMGTALLNGLLMLPYVMQLAYGWTKLSFYQNIIGLVAMVPLMIGGTFYFGAAGAGMATVLIHFGILAISVFFMHKKILMREQKKWVLQDVFVPFLASLLVVGAARVFIPITDASLLMQIVFFALLFLLSLCAAVLCAPYARQALFFRFNKKMLTQ